MTASLEAQWGRYGIALYERVGGVPGRPSMRMVYISKSVRPFLDQSKSRIAAPALAGIYALLNRFVDGGRMLVSTSPRGRGDIKGLAGYESKLFEIRFSDIAPQHRMIGVFPAKDVFLALTINNREEIDGRWREECEKALGRLAAMGANEPTCLRHGDMSKVLTNWAMTR